MATIRDVADRAGVAPSTVSLVLNRKPWVSKSIQRSVTTAIEELQYVQRKKGRPRVNRPNGSPIRRKNQIALLLPHYLMEQTRLSNGLIAELFHGIQTACNKAGKNLVVNSLIAQPRILHSMATKVDGLVLMKGEDTPPILDELSQRVPCVRAMGVPTGAAPWDHVTYNNGSVGRLAAEFLLERGHRICAYLAPYAGTPVNLNEAVPPQTLFEQRETQFMQKLCVERERLFTETITAAGGTTLTNQPGDCRWLPNLPAELMEVVKELLFREPRPTALFVPFDEVTQMVYAILPRLGIRPGVDLDIVSCNNDAKALRGLYPCPGTVDIQTRWVGVHSVQLLLERMSTPDLPRMVVRLEPAIVLPSTVSAAETFG
jgi:DNA-binding LacI/PurR family transcriptional regulator